MAHQMGGFDVEKTRHIFNIPTEFALMAMIAVGYQGEPEVLDDNQELKELELAARARTALGVHFFEGDWGIPVKS